MLLSILFQLTLPSLRPHIPFVLKPHISPAVVVFGRGCPMTHIDSTGVTVR